MNLGELGDFVESRRDRIRPADIGLPPGNRRRVPGLRREEVAQLAGASTDYHDGAATCRLDRPCSFLRGVPAAEVSDGYGIPLGAEPGGDRATNAARAARDHCNLRHVAPFAACHSIVWWSLRGCQWSITPGFPAPRYGAAPGRRPRMISVQGSRPTSGFCLHLPCHQRPRSGRSTSTGVTAVRSTHQRGTVLEPLPSVRETPATGRYE